MASVSSAHEWRPKAGSQTSSATFRPWAIKVLPQRLRHLGSEAMALACHAAGPKGPTIPDDGFGGASNAFHTRRVTRRHGRATRTTAWAPRPERDKHYLLVHVILTGLTGCAHPERVRGVTCDQPGPRIPQNRSLTSAARANDASQKVEWWFDTCCPNFGSHPPASRNGKPGSHITVQSTQRVCHFTSQSTLPSEAIPDGWRGHY